MARTRTDAFLLGKWASLRILAGGPAHGYDISVRPAPTGDIGRVWSLSRSLTYRALGQLGERGLVQVVGEEPGRAGGNRTILAVTRSGRSALRRWLTTPVPHVRAELLLKLVLCDVAGVDPRPIARGAAGDAGPDGGGPGRLGSVRRSRPVSLWRYEASRAAQRFVERMLEIVEMAG